MKSVSEVMTGCVHRVAPEQTLAEAALLMRDKDIGSVAVHSEDQLVGLLTDRDIAVRAVAAGLGPATPVREVMSRGVKYCFEDQDIDEVVANMAKLEVRRLPVVNRNKRLVGFVSLSNIADAHDADATRALLKSVARPH